MIEQASSWRREVKSEDIGLDAILHLSEFALAVYEGAFFTSVLTGFHSLIFIIGVYLLNVEHKHQSHDNEVV